MAKKPTYEESERRIKELDNEVLKHHHLEEELERIFDFSLDMIGFGNLEGYFIKINSSFEKILGYADEEFLNRPFISFVHKQDVEKTAEALDNARKGKTALLIENRYICKDGSYKWIEWKVQTLLRQNKFIAVGRDITERRQAEEELKKHRDHLEMLIAERTKEIQKVNEKLQVEISEHKKAEDALRKSEEKYRLLAENATDVIWTLDMNLRLTYISPSVFQLRGYTVEEAMAQSLDEILFPESRTRAMAILNQNLQLIEGGNDKGWAPVTFETKQYCKDGTSIITSNNAKMLKGPDGRPNLILGVTHDITDRRRTEDKLKESEDRYKKLLEINPNAIAIVQGFPPRHLFVNSAYTELFGYTLNDVENEFSPFEVIQKKDKAEIERKMYDRNAGRELAPRSEQVDLVKKNGKIFPCEIFATLINYEGYVADMLVFRDISKRKRSEKLIQDLSHQLLTSQESERQRISFELHDSVAQELSTSKIICEMLLKDNSFTPGVREQVLKLSENLHKTLNNVRDLSYELRPPGLEDLGLTHAMNRLCQDFAKDTGILVDFHSVAMDNLNLNYNTKINLYRVLQESLSNVRKHSDARNVKIRLIASFPNIILRIEDDGKGFDLKDRLTRTSSEKRMGLSNMKERVALLLGSIDIKSIPGKGSKVSIKVPQSDENIGTKKQISD